MKILTAALLIICAAPCLAQTAKDSEGIKLVTIHANGADISEVLDQLFTQAKKNYVLQPGRHFSLNLNLEKFEFEEALQVICTAGHLKTDLQNGIYYVDREVPAKPKQQVAYQAISPAITAITGFIPQAMLDKKVTTNLHKAPLKTVLSEFTRYAHVKFEVDPAVPSLKLDAILSKVPLRVALQQVTDAARLTYTLTNHQTIVIRKAQR